MNFGARSTPKRPHCLAGRYRLVRSDSFFPFSSNADLSKQNPKKSQKITIWVTKNQLMSFMGIFGLILAREKNLPSKIEYFDPIWWLLTEKCGFFIICEFQNFQNLITQNITFLQFLASKLPLNCHKWPKT